MMETEGGQREANAFERWIEPALPPARLWRLALGLVVGLLAWLAIGYITPWIYYYGWIALGDETSWEFWQEMSALDIGSTHLAVVVLLVSSTGFWAAAWLAARLHRQPFWSLVSPARRINWRWFGIGVLVFLGELGIGWAIANLWPSPMPYTEPRFNQPDLLIWVAFVPPIVALTFVQAGGEELFFRGYLMQRLAARFHNPMIWILAPSLVFGALHFFSGVTLEHSVYYMASTALFGVSAAVTVWRTGDVSLAIGYHFATNILAFLVHGADDFFIATPLWLSPVSESIASMPSVILVQILLLVFLLSPWGPKARPGKRKAAGAVTMLEH